MNLNHNAVKIVRKMLREAEELRINSAKVGGATLIDCGVHAEGSVNAGELFIRACMGGLAEVKFSQGENGLQLVEVATEHPALACFGSQKAGWRVAEGNYYAIASGPARILARKPRETYENLGYSERTDEALITLEAGGYPSTTLVGRIAKACNIAIENLYILIARTASLVGSIQISARAAETALFKLNRLGYDINIIEHASGLAPVAPVVGDDAVMMGVTNDMIIYGSRVYITSPVGLEVERIPSSSSHAYGKPFGEIFKEAGHDFYKIDQDIFAPAEVHFKNTSTGEMIKAGRVNYEIIKRSGMYNQL
ncbi:MAG: methenyltetrahydromethanopterin cyclohydrolase [Candidatus Hydrothermarchaeota archaeon]|jgi:methenyltetrahydromethanopterin cyclohydrolase|nr:methenyltetrahydromethanopterin cyclohydrolase [Candidatus Hydrothermarchaeota archaeon]